VGATRHTWSSFLWTRGTTGEDETEDELGKTKRRMAGEDETEDELGKMKRRMNWGR
jgi:hypothetical protein